MDMKLFLKDLKNHSIIIVIFLIFSFIFLVNGVVNIFNFINLILVLTSVTIWAGILKMNNFTKNKQVNYAPFFEAQGAVVLMFYGAFCLFTDISGYNHGDRFQNMFTMVIAIYFLITFIIFTIYQVRYLSMCAKMRKNS